MYCFEKMALENTEFECAFGAHLPSHVTGLHRCVCFWPRIQDPWRGERAKAPTVREYLKEGEIEGVAEKRMKKDQEQ